MKVQKSKSIKSLFLITMVIFCAGLFAVNVGAASAADYYVSVSGSNSDTGLSVDHAWATPSYAAQQAVAGDTIYLIDDTPDNPDDSTWENEHITFANSGTESAPIVMKAYNGTPTLDGVDETGTAISAKYGKHYITIQGLTIRHYDYGIAIRDSDNCHILDCEVYYNYGGTMGFGFTNNCTMENCVLHDCGWNLVGMAGSTSIGGDNNSIINCTVYNAGYRGRAHALIDLSGELTNTTIQGCTLYNGSSGGIYTHQTGAGLNYLTIKDTSIDSTSASLHFEKGTNHVLVENLTITNEMYTSGHHVHFGGSADVIFRNSYIYGGDILGYIIQVSGSNYLFDSNYVGNEFGDTEYRLSSGGIIRNNDGENFRIYADSGEVTVEYTDGRTFSVDGSGEYATYTFSGPAGHTIDVFSGSSIGTISGIVTNTTGSPIQGATVSDGTRPDDTNVSGIYTIENVPVGTYTVTALASGYQNSSQSNITVNEDQATTVNFQLTETTTEPTPPIVYVATDGTGDYNCNGTDDQIQINQAIDYVDTHSNFTTVHLKAGTYIIDGGPYSIILKGNNRILEGDGSESTTIKLKDGNNYLPFIYFLYADSIDGYTIRDIKIDGNIANNPSHNSNQGSYGIYMTSSSNCLIYNIAIINLSVDGIHVHGNNFTIHSSTFSDGHDSIWITDGSGHHVYNCTMHGGSDKAIRLYRTKGCVIEYCDMKAGDDVIGIFTEGSGLANNTTIQNCIIRNNNPNSNWNGPGIRLLARSSSTITNTTIKNNITVL